MKEQIKEYLDSNDEGLVSIGIELLELISRKERYELLAECGLKKIAGKMWFKHHTKPISTSKTSYIRRETKYYLIMDIDKRKKDEGADS